MKFQNPIIRGYYPDPSVCRANGKYYLVASSFHYFPGVPLFESVDLINWRLIGYCLTRTSQLPLDNAHSSGGIFAPTIRYNDGRFYMVTTNVTGGGNFYVYTDDIYGEWSERIMVEQDGIDPSLYFEGGKAYFMSNGTDSDGRGAVFQCEIDIKTGKKLSESVPLWHGSGGRYLESPHLYKIGKFYYLTAAEGGTEYGHMVTYARSENINGSFTSYAKNPVLTNRDLGGYCLQGIGHADLTEDDNGNWWLFSLGFRQIDKWLPFHHLGREVCLTPVTFDENGWFTASDGTTAEITDTTRLSESATQKFRKTYTFGDNGDDFKEWQFIRRFDKENYIFGENSLKIKSGADNLNTAGAPAFIGLHQKEFDMELSVKIGVTDKSGEAGVSVYMDEKHHYDIAVSSDNGVKHATLILNVGDIRHTAKSLLVNTETPELRIKANAYAYEFYCEGESLGSAQTRYVSSEVACGFTGVLLGLFSQNGGGELNTFTDFTLKYK